MRRSSRAFVGALVLAVGLLALPALAATYWTAPQVLKSFFAKSKSVSHRRITLPDATRTAIAKKLGVPSIKADWTIYVAATDDDKRSGYAILDNEKGMHEDIDYAVQFSTAGEVERVEIMVYREAYGDEVRRETYRKQFRGKTPRDPITAGQDIDIISGASISSKSVARGVKRDVLVLEAAIQSGSL